MPYEFKGNPVMSDHIEKTLGELQSKLHEQEDAVIQTKKLINLLCEHSGKPAMYTDADLEAPGNSIKIQFDQFYGKKLITAMREILEIRKGLNQGPATPREIYDTLIEGGYAFETENEANRLTGVRISLRKASSIFHRLPDGKRYGLLSWYPKAKKNKNAETSNDDSQNEETEDDLSDDLSNETTN